ncbi:MAG: TldD/PmbA family protein [Promethearchaeota archaeon]
MLFDQKIEIMQDLISLVPPSKFYADILYDSISSLSIKKNLGGEVVSGNLKTRGFVFRVFDGQYFHEIAAAASEIPLLADKVQALLDRIEYSSEIDLIPVPKHSLNQVVRPDNYIDFTKITLEEKQKKVAWCYDYLAKCPKVINPAISYSDILLERIFVNTEGSVLRQKIPRSTLSIMPVVKVENKFDFDIFSFDGVIGFEMWKKITSEGLDSLVSSSIEIAQAPFPPSGVMPVILDPTISGSISHDVFGHGVQADQVIRGRSYWEKYFHKEVASEFVNISDDPLRPGLFGAYLFDDEGVLAQKTPIVENGVLTHYLHSRLTASKLHAELRGNGRRQDFLHPIYARNSNTFFEPGDYSLTEMIREMNHGVLIESTDFGMEDPIGGSLQCNSRSGYLIENGEKTTRVKGIALSGNARELLLHVDAVSNDICQFEGLNSRKGREDIVPVSFGGVFVRSQKAIIGPG